MKHLFRYSLLSAVLALVSAVQAQPVVVNTTDGSPAPNGSLRWAVETAAAEDTITFNLPALDNLIILTEGQILIDKDLAIDGTDAAELVTISADGASRLFQVDESSVLFKSVDLIDGTAVGQDGGCIQQNGGTLRLTDVNMSGCSALRGGAVFADSAIVFVRWVDLASNPEFRNNTARHGGAVYTNESRFDASQTDLLDNTVDSLGGALYAKGDDIDLDLLEVADNTAWNGGGVYLDDALFQSDRSDFARNAASNRGGSVFTAGGSLIFLETEIEDSRAGSLGGGLYVTDTAQVQFSLSAVARDTADVDGGGMFVSGASDVLIANSTFDRNYAEDGGGGIYVFESDVDLNGATVSKNRASAGGGIFGGQDAYVSLRNATVITENNADLGMSGLSGGGGVFMSGNADSLRMRHTTVSLNFAEAGRGGGIFNQTQANIFDSSHIIVNEAEGNSGGAGGGIYNQGTMTITDSRVTGNMTDMTLADSRGGGIYNFGHLTIESSTISSNQAKGEGGGIANSDTTVIKNSTISANISKDDDGGGILNWGVLEIEHSTITQNEAEFLGGGIYDVFVSNGPVSLYSSIVAGNSGASNTDIGINGANAVVSMGYNLVGDSTGTKGMEDGVNNDQVGSAASPLNPGLAGLELNGGDTRTHALLPGSPALDQGDCSLTGVSADQRGEIRPIDDASASNAGDGCDVGSFELDASAGVAIDLDLLLEGPYSELTDMMTVDLNAEIPEDQPFQNADFLGTRLEYSGLEHLDAIPGNAVDWVLVNLLTGDPSNPPLSTAATRAGLLLADGSVVDLDGSTSLTFPGAPAGFYYVAAFGRNHLGVMSADSLSLSAVAANYDFTSSDAAAFGMNPMAEMETGVFGLWSADGNVDGQVTAGDFNLWLADTKAALTGYLLSDFNMDSQVTATDFNLWLTNTKAAVTSQVP